MKPGGIDRRGLRFAVNCELNWKLPPRLSAIQRLGHQLPAPRLLRASCGSNNRGRFVNVAFLSNNERDGRDRLRRKTSIQVYRSLVGGVLSSPHVAN